MSSRNRPSPRRPGSTARPMAVPMEQPRKQTGCGSIGAGVLLLVLVLLVLLILLGILPNPLEANPTATNLPAGITTQPGPTETSAPVLSATFTPTSTQTLEPTATQTPEPTKTSTPNPTERPMPFVVKGTPQGYPNSMLFPQYSCEEFLFIGGEILDLRDAPVLGLTVRLGGTYGGSLLDLSSVSGEVPVYGQSGYGFAIDNQRIRESGITIQLFDENGEALSALTYLSVTGNCDTNLLIVNYKQVREIQP